MKGTLCKCLVPDTDYVEKYDAFYCKRCDAWLEKSCRDEWCGFCKDRPERPSQVVEEAQPSQAQ